MFFFNLSVPEFLLLFGTLSALVVALYLLNRARRRQTVSTLRFWNITAQSTQTANRRRIQQPWSLALQLLALLLLCLAIAQLRTGPAGRRPVDHVLLLDSSSWMSASDSKGNLLDQAKGSARAYLRALPASDRVMIVYADALATPTTGFEEDRAVLLAAIDRARPSASALDLDQALRFASQMRSLHARKEGEVVFIGAGRSTAEVRNPAPSNFRYIPVSSRLENAGLRRVGLRRSGPDGSVWQVFVATHNYGSSAQTAPLIIQFGGAPVGARRVVLKPGETVETTFEFQTAAAGWLEARLLLRDALPEDNRAIIEVPRQQILRVAIFSADPGLLRPIISAHPQLKASYQPLSAYTPDVDTDLVILDRFRPAAAPLRRSLWIDPPGAGRAIVRDSVVEEWASDHEIGSGLKSRRIKLETAQILPVAPGDKPVARVAGGPVVIARSEPAPSVIFGFHPGRESTRFDLSTPLLFANTLRWLAPGFMRESEVHVGAAGSVSIPLADHQMQNLSVTSGGKPVPFNVHGSQLRFFAGEPGTVRVSANGSEQVYSLTLPEVAENLWEAPSSARLGLPAVSIFPMPSDWWRFLAVAAAFVLLAEYLLFGRARPRRTNAPSRRLSRWNLRKAS